MRTKHTTADQMDKALEIVNQQYKKNVAFERLEKKGSGHHFTLRVIDSKAPGHRLGQCLKKDGTRRRMAKACWHVHGHFFEALLSVNEDAVIRSGDIVIDKNGGNWQDRNIGSMYSPLYFSEACDCD